MGCDGAGGMNRRTLPGMILSEKARWLQDGSKFGVAEKLRTKYNAKRAYDNIDDLLADPSRSSIHCYSSNYHKGSNQGR